MRLRDSVALTLPSFLLRLVLAITFIWAGCGKLLGTMEISGDQAARLANLGVALTPPPVPAPARTTPPPQGDPTEPLESLPGTDGAPTPKQNPERNPPKAPSQSPPSTQPGAGSVPPVGASTTDRPAQPAAGSNASPATPTTPAATDPQPEAGEIKDLKTQARRPGSAALSLVQYSPAHYAPSDFPEPVVTKRVYAIALMISYAADPGLTPDSQPIPPIMPTGLANGPWPIVLAWAAAITELGGGVLLLLGLLTRISALGTFCVMLVAMWMTQFGPAAIHTTDAILGFIPNNQPWYDPESYSTLLWQLALAAMSLAVVFLGSGAIGIDRLLFSASPRDPYVHGDPKAAPRTGRSGPAPSGGSRSEFDRSPNPTP